MRSMGKNGLSGAASARGHGGALLQVPMVCAGAASGRIEWPRRAGELKTVRPDETVGLNALTKQWDWHRGIGQ
jgi:hypothetical protein